ncbi:MAG TPA: decaprenyl-phosphate phosphoribosyltransferase [Candidatus Hydrogenedentes bacterium]|nr:decaprenyl-phosphate phosphoribosyltransferase [Candidatus Hydrogenedentota bacterium]HOH50141.1 decaprenyl-phosphate phosphoribosyltransferase [Candidatus Hydrogenedentota bacterium]HQL95004.1 decaprenyl-phosphate phosphoribosyltransferase [Candidatus Hydrogenedentota bacterium]HRZ84100.1 decaprenyl-phosphate phosphoribosyltransferase [Candidatus Hydrogenedentota bacterium]
MTDRMLLIPRLLRVYQWPKNLLVLLPLVFAQALADARADILAVAAFAAFCLASSATYLVNDLHDLDQDRRHPDKKSRPLASGRVSPAAAALLAAALLAGAFAAGFPAGRPFLLSLAGYVLLSLSYTFLLKHVFLVDVLVVSLGFVIRATAGAVAIRVAFSNWLVVCTFFLALFLVLGKRRREISLLQGEAENHRAVLAHYTVNYIDHLLMFVAAGALITYTIYTCSPEVVDRLGTDKMYLTLPLVVYGIARYLWLVQEKESGGDPANILLSDWPIVVTVGLWVAACAAILHLR